jgi:serine/threonine-protein kinase RsbW
MKYLLTEKPSSDPTTDDRSSNPLFYFWDADPALSRQFLSDLRPEPGSCSPLPPESAWSEGALGLRPRVVLAASSPDLLPWERIAQLREVCGARLLLLLPDCDARLWWRLTRCGFVDVLSPPFGCTDLELEFADWGRRAPLAQRLPDLERCLRSRLEFSFPAQLKYIGPAAGFTSRIAREHGFHPKVWAENLPLALGEALTNAVEHGCKGDPSLSVHVELRVDYEVLKVRIEDEGEGFDCDAVPDPLGEEGLHLGSGRGMLILRKLVDRVVFEKDGRVVLLYVRRLPPVESS